MPPCALCGKPSETQVCSACMDDLASAIFFGGKVESDLRDRLAVGLKRRQGYEASMKQVTQLTQAFASMAMTGKISAASLHELALAVKDAVEVERKLAAGKSLAESMIRDSPTPQRDRLRIDALEF